MVEIISNLGEKSIINKFTEVLKEQSIVRIITELYGFFQEAINVSLTGQPPPGRRSNEAYIILDKIFALNIFAQAHLTLALTASSIPHPAPSVLPKCILYYPILILQIWLSQMNLSCYPISATLCYGWFRFLKLI